MFKDYKRGKNKTNSNTKITLEIDDQVIGDVSDEIKSNCNKESSFIETNDNLMP